MQVTTQDEVLDANTGLADTQYAAAAGRDRGLIYLRVSSARQADTD